MLFLLAQSAFIIALLCTIFICILHAYHHWFCSLAIYISIPILPQPPSSATSIIRHCCFVLFCFVLLCFVLFIAILTPRSLSLSCCFRFRPPTPPTTHCACSEYRPLKSTYATYLLLSVRSVTLCNAFDTLVCYLRFSSRPLDFSYATFCSFSPLAFLLYFNDLMSLS